MRRGGAGRGHVTPRTLQPLPGDRSNRISILICLCGRRCQFDQPEELKREQNQRPDVPDVNMEEKKGSARRGFFEGLRPAVPAFLASGKGRSGGIWPATVVSEAGLRRRSCRGQFKPV